VWQQQSEKQACRIKWPQPVEGKITDQTPEQQAESIEWGVDAINIFQDEFEPRIADL